MAHATDYQSRRPVKVDKIKRAEAQVVQFLKETSSWKEETQREYCLRVYKVFGVTAEVFNKAMAQFRAEGVKND